MKTFDFYCFYIVGDSVEELKNCGILRQYINSEPNGFRKYGNKRYPRQLYTATVRYLGAVNASSKIVDNNIAELTKLYGKSVYAKYITRD